MQAYCMKCKRSQDMVNLTEVTLKNGKPAAQGNCAVCNTRVFRMGRVERT